MNENLKEQSSHNKQNTQAKNNYEKAGTSNESSQYSEQI